MAAPPSGPSTTTSAVFSIVTVTRNAAADLERTLASIREQRGVSPDVVVVDGGSTDGTAAVLDRYRELGWTILSEADAGVYDGMNKGVRLARGEWVNFMNAGDVFAGPDVLRELAAALAGPPAEGADYVYGDVISDYGGGERRLTRAKPLRTFWKNKPFNHQALFARRRWLRRFPFDLQYRIVADYDQALRAFRAGAKFVHLPLVIAVTDMQRGLSKRSLWYNYREKARVNLRYADRPLRVRLYLVANGLLFALLITLRRLGLFHWAARAKQQLHRR